MNKHHRIIGIFVYCTGNTFKKLLPLKSLSTCASHNYQFYNTPMADNPDLVYIIYEIRVMVLLLVKKQKKYTSNNLLCIPIV